MRAQLDTLSRGSKFAEHVRYGLRHWGGLVRFLDDGRLELDTNTIEREIRPVALTRKAALFAGSAGGGVNWAIATTLIRTALMHGRDPEAWLTAVLERMVRGEVRATELDTLLPWQPADIPNAAAAYGSDPRQRGRDLLRVARVGVHRLPDDPRCHALQVRPQRALQLEELGP